VSVVPNTDTPDGQYSTVSAQQIIGNFAAGNITESVNLPPNTETLLILTDDPFGPIVKKIVGNTTGFDYSFSALPNGAGGGVNSLFVCSVVPSVDAAVTITWSSAPTTSWYVVADAAVRQIFDEAIAQVIGLVSAGAPYSALVVAGLSSGYIQPLSLDVNNSLLVTAGFDGTNTHRLSTDASGTLNVNVLSGGGGGLTYLSSYLAADTSTGGAGAYVDLVDLALTAGTWLLFGMAVIQRTTVGAANIDVNVGPNSASAVGAYCAASGALGNVAGQTEAETLTCTGIVVLASTTTIHLNASSSAGAGTAKANSLVSSTPHVTGILAVKIA